MAIKTAASPTLNVKQQDYVTITLISKNGTVISYRQLGHGPGIVILHGSMSTGYYSLQLAQLLARSFPLKPHSHYPLFINLQSMNPRYL